MTAKDAISELERLVPESVPTIKVEDIASGWLDFNIKLSLGEIPMPYWLQIGKAKYQITKQNYEGVARGMLITAEIQNFFSESRLTSRSTSPSQSSLKP